MEQTKMRRSLDTSPLIEAETFPIGGNSKKSEMAAILAAGIVRLGSRIGPDVLRSVATKPVRDESQTDRSAS